MPSEAILFVVVIFLGCALLVAALSRARQGSGNTANYYLSGFILISFYFATLRFLHSKDLFWDYPALAASVYLVGFLSGPLFYFYVLSLTNRSFRPGLRQLVHFALPAIGLGYVIVGLLWADNVQAWLVEPLPSWMRFPQVASLLFYLALAVKTVMAFDNQLEHAYSNLEGVKLTWLKLICLLMGIEVCVIVWYRAIGFPPDLQFIVVLSSIFVFYVACVFALCKSDIFSLNEMILQHNEELPEPPRESRLLPDDLERYKQKVEAYFKDSRIYRKSDLKIIDVARALNIPIYHLSPVVNIGFGKSFYRLVNSFRIEEAKLQLSQDRKNSILDVAYDVGFNSKSSFNASFKEITGLTPREFARRSAEQ